MWFGDILKSVLIVERDAIISLDLSTGFMFEGYEVYSASNVNDAISIAEDKSPDLIISETYLDSHLDGLKLYSTLSKDGFKGIFYSASCQDLTKSTYNGGWCCLHKPADYEALFELANKMLA